MTVENSNVSINVVNGLDAIDIHTEWLCGQISATVAGALALLPDEYEIYRGAALLDRLGDSPDQRGRCKMTHALSHVRTLLEGVRHNIDDLSNLLDCEVESLRDEFAIVTPEKRKRLAAVAKLSTSH